MQADAKQNSDRYRIDDLDVDLGQRCVFRGDQEIQLPKLSFSMLVALIKAAPVPDPKLARQAVDIGLTGDMPSMVENPEGCVFHGRCPYSVKRCLLEVPPLRRMENGDWVACHRAEELDLTIKAG